MLDSTAAWFPPPKQQWGQILTITSKPLFENNTIEKF